MFGEIKVTEKEKYLGEFEQIVMLALLRLGEEAYGASIRKTLIDNIGRDTSLGALYSTLERLEQKGMAISSFGTATPKRGGRPKKHYQVTAKGMQALKRSRSVMDKMWANIPTLLKGEI